GPDNNTYQAFRWTTADGMVGLGTLTGDMLSTARDVNGDGSVVVGESGNGSSWQAFYWTTSSGMESLEDVLASHGVNLGGLTLLGAVGVSDDGTIVIGYAQGNGDQTGFWA